MSRINKLTILKSIELGDVAGAAKTAKEAGIRSDFFFTLTAQRARSDADAVRDVSPFAETPSMSGVETLAVRGFHRALNIVLSNEESALVRSIKKDPSVVIRRALSGGHIDVMDLFDLSPKHLSDAFNVLVHLGYVDEAMAVTRRAKFDHKLIDITQTLPFMKLHAECLLRRKGFEQLLRATASSAAVDELLEITTMIWQRKTEQLMMEVVSGNPAKRGETRAQYGGRLASLYEDAAAKRNLLRVVY